MSHRINSPRNSVESKKSTTKPHALVTLNDLNDDYIRTAFLYSLVAIAVYFIVGILYYHVNAGWTVVDSLYFTVTTFATGTYDG